MYRLLGPRYRRVGNICVHDDKRTYSFWHSSTYVLDRLVVEVLVLVLLQVKELVLDLVQVKVLE